MAVGVGSIAFHMTMLAPMQMLNEVPMLYSAQIMVYTLLEGDTVEPRHGKKLPIALGVHAVVITLLTTLTSGRLQFLCFHASFGSMEFFARRDRP